MSRHGDRYVAKAKILQLMGSKADSKSHRLCVRRVLKGLLYSFGYPKPDSDDRRSVTFAVTSQSAQRPGSRGYDEKAGRSVTSRRLKDAQLVERFNLNQMEPLALAYYREHPNGQTDFVYAKACKVDRFLKFALDQGVTVRQSLESTDTARSFWSLLKRTLQPYSVRNHCDAIVDLLQLACALPTLKAMYPKHRRQKLNSALNEWQILRRCTDKDSRRLQSLKVKRLGFSAAPMYDICQYLVDYKNEQLEADFCEIESRIQENARFHRAARSAWKRLICYLSSIMALHGQRRGAAFQMTVSEVTEATTYEGMKIIAIHKHKTDYVMGPAYVAVKRHQYDALKRMAMVRLSLGGDQNSHVIASLTGGEPNEEFQPLELRLSEVMQENIQLTFNVVRCTAESHKNLGRGSAKSDSDRISSYLCHGEGVVRLHYLHKTPQDIVAEARALDLVHTQLILQEMGSRGAIPLPKQHFGKYAFLYSKNLVKHDLKRTFYHASLFSRTFPRSK